MFMENHKIFNTLVEHMPVGVYVLDKNWIIQYVNPAFEGLFGRSASSFLQRHPFELNEYIRIQDWQRYFNFVIGAADKDLSVMAYYIVQRDGVAVYVRDLLHTVRDEHGEVLFYQGMIEDISRYRQVKEELVQSRDSYQMLVNSMQEGYALMQVISTDKDSCDFLFMDVNPMFEQNIGLQREEIVGRRLERERFRLEDEWLELLNTVARTGQAVSYEGYVSYLDRYLQVFAFQPDEGLVAALIVDVTRRKQVELAMQEEKEWLAVTLKSIGEGVIATDVDNRVIFLNDAASEILGWSEEAAIGKSLIDILRATQEQSSSQEQEYTQHDFPEISDQSFTIVRNGQRRFIFNNASYIHDNSGEIKGMVMVLRDVTDRHQAQQEIHYLSFHDTLTGLHNRAYVDQVLPDFDDERLLPLSMILADLNGLKLTNDVFGHQAGDQLLVRLADIIRSSCRQEDVVARWGGDEFLIILPRTPYHAAEEVCERIREKCRQADRDPIEISCAMGVATRNTLQQDIATLFSSAEDRMYTSKLEESEQADQIILQGIIDTLNQRFYYRQDHCNRLQELALKMTAALQLDLKQKQHLLDLVLYHDIGHIILPPEYIHQGEYLTAEEWEKYKKHAEAGYRIASCMATLRPIADLILSHHEHWDGSGYPRGLAGEEIPFVVRIFSVLDAYDIMTRDTFAKPAMSSQEALYQIRVGAGKKFDPYVVRAFLNLEK